jgi:hypothetical protein
LQGSAERQLAALRDYLFRLAGSLESIQSAPAVSVGTAAKSGAGDAAEKIRQNARELKALILKTADTITAEMDSREEEYRGYYLAQSEFGDFEENLDLRIATSARNIIESYDYESAIRAAQDIAENVQEYYTQISGEIRRFLRDDGAVKVSRGVKEQAAKIKKTRLLLEKTAAALPAAERALLQETEKGLEGGKALEEAEGILEQTSELEKEVEALKREKQQLKDEINARIRD